MSMSYETYQLKRAARELEAVTRGEEAADLLALQKAFKKLWAAFQVGWYEDGSGSNELDGWLHRLEWYSRYLNCFVGADQCKEKP